MKSLLKDSPVSVYLNDEDARILAKAVEKERRRRGDVSIGVSTLLRECAMPRVRELAAAESVEAA